MNPMNGTKKTAEQRLGHYVMARRSELGYNTRQDLANELGMTVRTLSDIEHGLRRASPGSYAMLDAKLGWKPGSCAGVLAGGEPALLTRQFSELGHISTAEILGELRRRISGRGALDAFGGDWDNLPPPTPDL